MKQSHNIEFHTVESHERRGILAVLFLVSAGLLILGGIELKVVGLILLLLIAGRHLFRKGTVKIQSQGLRIRTDIWAVIEFASIESVGRFVRRMDGPERFILSKETRQAMAAMEKPAIGLTLRGRRWLWLFYPLPMPIYVNEVAIFLKEEDEEAFVEHIEKRLRV